MSLKTCRTPSTNAVKWNISNTEDVETHCEYRVGNSRDTLLKIAYLRLAIFIRRGVPLVQVKLLANYSEWERTTTPSPKITL